MNGSSRAARRALFGLFPLWDFPSGDFAGFEDSEEVRRERRGISSKSMMPREDEKA